MVYIRNLDEKCYNADLTYLFMNYSFMYQDGLVHRNYHMKYIEAIKQITFQSQNGLVKCNLFL